MLLVYWFGCEWFCCCCVGLGCSGLRVVWCGVGWFVLLGGLFLLGVCFDLFKYLLVMSLLVSLCLRGLPLLRLFVVGCLVVRLGWLLCFVWLVLYFCAFWCYYLMLVGCFF